MPALRPASALRRCRQGTSSHPSHPATYTAVTKALLMPLGCLREHAQLAHTAGRGFEAQGKAGWLPLHCCGMQSLGS